MNSEPVQIQRVNRQQIQLSSDVVAIEEPLEIRLSQGSEVHSISVTMRTPGHDAELAFGFLFTEGIIKRRSDVMNTSQHDANIITIELIASVVLDQTTMARNFYTTSSCGVCGKASIDAIQVNHDSITSEIQAGAERLLSLPHLARVSQKSFAETGGSHASTLFTSNGTLLLTREDVGRHNALDKLIGHCIMNGEAMSQTILLVSGRTSFELLQKAAVAGIPIVAAMGAPSSLAIKLAIESGITLIGFLKADQFNIYSHSQRITP